MKILLHEDPFPNIPLRNYFTDGSTRYYAEAVGNPARPEYEYFRFPGHAPEASSDSLLDCRLLFCGETPDDHCGKRINQQFLELQLILEGAMYIRCDKVTYLAEAGDVAVMPPHQDYDFRPAGKKVRSISAIIDGTMLTSILAGCGISRGSVFTPEAPLQETLAAFDALHCAMEEKAPDCVTGGIVFRLLVLLGKTKSKNQPQEQFSRLRKYVDDHIHTRNVLKDCCSTFGVSPYLLRQAFLSALHVTPKEYVTTSRMNRAAELLRQGESIKDAALQCGYDNSLNFSTAFRHWHHMPPGKYRKLHS